MVIESYFVSLSFFATLSGLVYFIGVKNLDGEVTTLFACGLVDRIGFSKLGILFINRGVFDY